MRKLPLIVFALLITTACFADQKVYVSDGSGNILNPYAAGQGLTVNQLPIATTATTLGATNNVCAVILSTNPNNTSNSMYIGDSNVTTSNGLFLASGTVLRLNVTSVSGLYAVSGVANQKLTILTQTE